MENNKYPCISVTTLNMINIILEVMREHNFIEVNVPLLLYGLIKYSDENGNPSEFLSYLCSIEASSLEIEYHISIMIDTLSKAMASVSSEPESTETHDTNVSSSSDSSDNDIEIIELFEEDDELTTFTLQYKNSRGDISNLFIPVDDEVKKVFKSLALLTEQYNFEELEPLHFITAMFMADIVEVKEFFDELDINYIEALKNYNPNKVFSNFSTFIPHSLSSFLTVINEKIDAKKPCEILMRDRETETLWNIMLKMNKRNAVIIGEPGVGKTALIEKITYHINKGDCPPEFKDFKVLSLDVNSLIAGTQYRGDAEQRIQELIKFLEKNRKIILFIDEVHTILGAGSCAPGEMDLANALKPILARGDTIVIGATTFNEYEQVFKRDAALNRRFEQVEVREPKSEDVYAMIKNKIKVLSDHHGVKINKKMVEYAIMIAGCFAYGKKNPDKTLDLLDRAMVSAKRAKKTIVDKESILSNFDIFFKMISTMSEDAKKATAYHEAGHYIFGKVSDKLIEYNLKAVSIMPAQDYLGVTVLEIDCEKVPFCNLDYFIDVIAYNLAGRVAESFFREPFTSGASEDLDDATKTAFIVVTKYGMTSNDSFKNRIYLNSEDYPMFSEKSIDTINDEVTKLIQQAFKRATALLEENKDILEAIVKALLKKQIMSEPELDKVWQKVVNRRNNNK